MKIKEIIQQYRRDFTALYECEHCGHIITSSGYDDAHFHNCVVPNMVCDECGKKADGNFRPLATKHPEGQVV